ncbi:efflux RND transporter periplasmic adaptor subunit [Chryseobacterium sp. WG23]|uniref:efflux RND transporter periplasmic adaptor subunit n=1 Tax=Chryseobacterium sp. WG23 TaxID=2926910 RepID=UPI00211EF1E7|nr:efflux RND transporter periplasmic adaptor subunit [Chryseobacterium sp. WG23]MCQ9637324.1 efflux RND transporter periplasmic adaptor subunit [Chryseobacterium sp. WG23]
MLYKSKIQKVGILIPLLGILLIACENKSEKVSTEKTTANADAAKLPVDIIVAQEKLLNHEEAVVGTMLPYREVSIVSEIPQKITKVAFKDGGYVSQGAVLYTLNDADIKSRLKQIGAELELAKLNKERMSNLLKTETVRQQEYDDALMRFRSLVAQQDLLRVELAKTVIRAPFSGKIGISKVFLGAYVTPGAELVKLQDQGSIKINFSVPEKYLPLIQTGNKVRFTSELSDQEYVATISATEPNLDAQGRSLQVQATANNAHGHFRAGLSAKVYFLATEKGAKGILVPTEALAPGAKGYTVFIIKNDVAKPTEVTISNRTETDAVITSGIAAGDSIIVSNMLRLGDGTPVKAILSK